jgi:ABC-type transporter Mla MlaB component
MFGRMKKHELQRIDSGYVMPLTEAISKAQELGKQLRLGQLSKNEHDMLLADLRTRAKQQKGEK